MTILAVQCRLSSSRLPGKALLPLGGKTVLDWTLSAMRKVPADAYYVATDESSYQALLPFCERNGFSVFKGPLEDVLERYCLLIEETGADTVIRATADNPFLFYEAAIELCEQYRQRSETSKCDYITFTSLPHGSGVEMFNAKSLLEARNRTDSAYDHEHVGPSLYNHPESFESVMLPAPEQWSHPEYRTTIDTPADYRRALAIVRNVSGVLKEPVSQPYTAQQILSAFSDSSVMRPVLTVPCVKKGKGTGHLRRCLSVALSIGADVYIPENSGLEELDEIVSDAKNSGLESWQIIRALPKKGDYSMVLTDAFALERDMAVRLAEIAPVCAIDEGSLNSDLCDFLIDIIPSYGISRAANLTDPTFVTLPKNKRLSPRPFELKEIKTLLVTVGGEDPADLVVPTCIALSEVFKNNSELKATAIVQDVEAAKNRL
ncbi:MAG: NTP transferase domain-containing protein, partial [Treponema sp.]|nr:NTP transferase domain-containing protein [Treponema sp.]